jgi:hypothetical protein
MEFADILKKHFDKGQHKALQHLLTEKELYRPLSDITSRFYAFNYTGDGEEALLHFRREAEAFVSVISHWLSLQDTGTNDEKKRNEVSAILVCITIEALKHYHLKPSEVFPLVNGLVRADAYLSEHHHDSFHWFIDKVHEKWLEFRPPDNNSSALPPPCSDTYFIWQIFPSDKENHITFDVFIMDLYRHWHRKICLSGLRQLFDSSGKPFKILVPSKYMLDFLTVFYLLHDCKRIFCKNNKGLFVFLKNHLQPPEGDNYPPWQDFAKLLHKELNHPLNGKILLGKIKKPMDKFGTNGLPD